MTEQKPPPPRKPADADRVASALADAAIMGDVEAGKRYGVSDRTIRTWRTESKTVRPEIGEAAAAKIQAALQEAHEERVLARSAKIDEALDEAINYIIWAASTRDKRPNPLMVQSLVSGLKALQEIKGGKAAEGAAKAGGFQIQIVPFGGSAETSPDE